MKHGKLDLFDNSSWLVNVMVINNARSSKTWVSLAF